MKCSDRLDYGRAGLGLSWLGLSWRALAGAALLLAGPAWAQYPGLIGKPAKAVPELRSVAVLEWTGEPGKPSASRLVPVAVYDGQQLNDGTLYLNRPEPMALGGGVEYELQTAGKPIGIYDVFGAADIKGSWQGFGAWKPLTAADSAKAKDAFNTSQLYTSDDNDNDRAPVLKRKHSKGTDTDDPKSTSESAGGNSGSGSGSGIGSTSDTSAKDAPSDPDRPKLKRKTGDSGGASGNASASNNTDAPTDPDRPTIRRQRNPDEAGMLETSTAAPDPDRPRLKRGKPDSLAVPETSRLTGYPPSLQQAVAVSDASNRAEHPWKYSWSNPDDEAKMKDALEAMARTALGLDPPAPKPVRKTATGQTPVRRKPVPLVPPEPVALADETFRVFELAYGSNATLVLTAASPLPDLPVKSQPEVAQVAATQPAAADRPIDPGDTAPVIQRGKPTVSSTTTAPVTAPKQAPAKTGTAKAGASKATKTVTPPAQKFVTLIAQPDLYGGIVVLYKSVTDAAHLDERPRMRLVDAVDAEGDNRGELLFELRGKDQRQFAMYRVLRGSAEQLFATVALPGAS
jgi:hypothetical protein